MRRTNHGQVGLQPQSSKDKDGPSLPQSPIGEVEYNLELFLGSDKWVTCFPMLANV